MTANTGARKPCRPKLGMWALLAAGLLAAGCQISGARPQTEEGREEPARNLPCRQAGDERGTRLAGRQAMNDESKIQNLKSQIRTPEGQIRTWMLNPPIAQIAQRDEHKFWDAQNVALISAGAGLRAGDIYTTKRFLRLGGQEAVLPRGWVESTPKFVAYHAAGQAIFTLAAWGFHRTRHHRLERALLWIQAGTTAGFVVNNSFYIRRLERRSYPGF